MEKRQKMFLLTLLRLLRDNKIRYNKLYFANTINKIDLENLIKEIEELK